MSINFTKIKALCFDVDGTLRDTDDQYVAKLEKTFRSFSRFFPNRDVHTFSRRVVMTLDTPINAVYTLMDWLKLDGAMIGMLEKYHEVQLRKTKASLPLVPGTLQSLELLERHYPLAIVSARGEKGTLEFLEHHHLTDKFACIASGQTTQHTKPWPDPILWCAKQMNVPAENCLMIGDTTVDIRAGRAASAQTVGVLSGFGSSKELTRAGANLIVNNVAEFTKIFHNRLV